MIQKSFFQSFIKRQPLIGILVIMASFNFLIINNLFAQQRKGLQHDLFSVSFPNGKDGWVCGRWGTILHTADSGSTWLRQQSGTKYTLSSICFVDSLKGWAVGDGGTILHTNNGGQNWVKQKGPVSYFLMGVHFANAQKGWIVTERTNILYTEDGGKSWGIQFKDDDFILKSVSFCDERNGWAVGEYGYIYHTDDGGKSWKRQAGEFGFSEKTGEIVAGNLLFDVIAVHPSTAWVVGIDGYVAKTLDGGKTWMKVTNGIPKGHLFGVTNKRGSLAIGGNTILLNSSDGGKSFGVTKAEPPITYGWIYRIVPRGEVGFAAIGKRGWIYLSDKEGVFWHRIVY